MPTFLFRSIVRQLHLIAGLCAGIVIFIVALTGCIYCFEEEIRSAVLHDLYTVQQTRSQHLPMSELVKIIKEKFPEQKIKNIFISTKEDQSIQVNFKSKIAAFIDPYSGKILGAYDMEKEFLGLVLNIHRSLTFGDTGKIITGTSALVFLFMIISGIILWWPNNNRMLKYKLSLKFKAPKFKLLYDLHSVLGFYGSWILLFMVLSGLVFAFKWFEKGVYAVTGSTKEPRMELVSGEPVQISAFPVDLMMDYKKNYPNAEGFVLSVPEDEKGVYRLLVNRGEKGFYKKQDHLYFDRYTGELIKKKIFEGNSTGEKLRSTNYNIHTGQVFGLFGKILVFFAGLVAASLPVTGVWMYFFKLRIRN